MEDEAKTVLRRHERHVRGRYELRHFLDIKAKGGLAKAALHALTYPAAVPAIVSGIAADKFSAVTARRSENAEPTPLRYLLPGRIQK
jgi:succinoglycan biosynthesis protein ExoU